MGKNLSTFILHLKTQTTVTCFGLYPRQTLILLSGIVDPVEVSDKYYDVFVSVLYADVEPAV